MESVFNSENICIYILLYVVNCAAIWEFLESCDYLRATTSVLVAVSVLNIGNYEIKFHGKNSFMKIFHHIFKVQLHMNEVKMLKNAALLTQVHIQ